MRVQECVSVVVNHAKTMPKEVKYEFLDGFEFVSLS